MLGVDANAPRSLAAGCLILLALALPIYLFGIGSTGLSDPDEPYYALVAKEMAQTGDYLVPLFHGRPWFDKPILFYWVVLAGYRLLGVSEAGARVGSALAAVGGVLAVFLIGRAHVRSRLAAFGAAIILATSLEYVVMGRAAVTDMTLTLFITLGMLSAARVLSGGGASWAALSGAAFGLATLTKGPLGIVVPAAGLLLYVILARRTDALRVPWLAAASGAFLLTAGPWYAYMAVHYRDLLVGTFLGEGNLGRFLTPEHRAMPFYYAAVVLAGLLPWSGALPAALLRTARPASWSGERGPGGRPGTLFFLCWFATVVVLFSLAASKLPSYVLPAFPPAALLLGDFWAGALAPPEGPQMVAEATFSAWLGPVCGLACVGALASVMRRPPLAGAAHAALAAGAIAIGGATLAILPVRRRSWTGFFLMQAGAAVAAILVLCAVALPRIEEFDSTRPLVRQIRDARIDDRIAGIYRAHDVSLVFYLGREVPFVDDPQELRRRVSAAPGGFWIVLTRDLRKLRSIDGLTVEPVLERPSRSVVRLSSAPPPEGT